MIELFMKVNMITAVHKNRGRLTFSPVTLADVTKEINIRNSSKAIQKADLPVKLLKDNKDFFAACKAKYFNDSLKSAKFPSWHLLLQFSNARTSKNKYRPVSVLPVIFKIFEHIIGKQLSAFFEDIFSKFQCAFHKGYNTRLYPLMMLES